jgi:hypothetical protein
MKLFSLFVGALNRELRETGTDVIGPGNPVWPLMNISKWVYVLQISQWSSRTYEKSDAALNWRFGLLSNITFPLEISRKGESLPSRESSGEASR